MPAQDCMIDVSHNNGVIDFHRLKDEFPNGAVVQIKATQGTSFVDSQFHANANACEALGWGWMPYHFCNAEDAEAQWAHFRSVAELAPGMAYMLDWERFKGVAASVAQMDILGQRGVDITGRVPMGYWGSEKLGAAPDHASEFMLTWDRQVPRYRRANDPHYHGDDPGIPCLAYQYTQWGRFAGIENGVGNVDRSVLFMGSIAEAIHYCRNAPAASDAQAEQSAQKAPEEGQAASRLLKLGMTGSDVVTLQVALEEQIPVLLKAESPRFGEATADAVRLFQKARGLGVDGTVGSLTKRALGII